MNSAVEMVKIESIPRLGRYFNNMNRAAGWRNSWPDYRDLTNQHPEIITIVNNLTRHPVTTDSIIELDLRSNCSPIKDQLQLGSCTAQAVCSMIEYYQIVTNNQYVPSSPLFLYKATRDSVGDVGDTGATLRDTMKTLRLIGAAPESLWKYDIKKYDEIPHYLAGLAAKEFNTIRYWRHDAADNAPATTFNLIKDALSKGLPVVGGFSCFSSIDLDYTEKTGMVPFPQRGEECVGGHAILLVGFSNRMTIKHPQNSEIVTTGAFIFKNSWGKKWGNEGYGFLPFEYVTRGMFVDAWSIFEMEWVDMKFFS